MRYIIYASNHKKEMGLKNSTGLETVGKVLVLHPNQGFDPQPLIMFPKHCFEYFLSAEPKVTPMHH